MRRLIIGLALLAALPATAQDLSKAGQQEYIGDILAVDSRVALTGTWTCTTTSLTCTGVAGGDAEVAQDELADGDVVELCGYRYVVDGEPPEQDEIKITPHRIPSTGKLRTGSDGACVGQTAYLANLGATATEAVLKDGSGTSTVLSVGTDSATVGGEFVVDGGDATFVAADMTITDGAAIIMQDQDDDTTVTMRVTDGTTTLGLTGSLSASSTLHSDAGLEGNALQLRQALDSGTLWLGTLVNTDDTATGELTQTVGQRVQLSGSTDNGVSWTDMTASTDIITKTEDCFATGVGDCSFARTWAVTTDGVSHDVLRIDGDGVTTGLAAAQVGGAGTGGGVITIMVNSLNTDRESLAIYDTYNPTTGQKTSKLGLGFYFRASPSGTYLDEYAGGILMGKVNDHFDHLAGGSQADNDTKMEFWVNRDGTTRLGMTLESVSAVGTADLTVTGAGSFGSLGTFSAGLNVYAAAAQTLISFADADAAGNWIGLDFTGADGFDDASDYLVKGNDANSYWKGDGTLGTAAGFAAAGSAGLTTVITVRDSGGAGDCTITVTGGIVTATTCSHT
jgi:hypothetical protein